jgi:hypothetical protein
VDVLLMVLLWGSIAALVWVLRRRRRPATDLRESFADARFATPSGEVGGNAVRVVRIERQGLFADVDPFDVRADMLLLAESFWYCVGPGPSYFVAIPAVERQPRGVAVKWIVRSLSEAQLRSALSTDAPALDAAFGHDAPPFAGDVRYRLHQGVPRPARGASAWPTPPAQAAVETKDAAPAAGLAALGGLAVAVITVPPVMGFYWGWNTPGQFDPWLHALGQAFMSWVIYLYALADGELLHTAQGRSVALAFVAVTVVFAWVFMPPRHTGTPATEPPR